MTTRPCVFCHCPITAGLLCADCVKYKEQIVAAGGVINAPGYDRYVQQTKRELDKHRRWVEEGHVPEFAQT